MVPIRVLLADDHPLVRFGIRKLLDMTTGLTVVGEASNGVEALQQAIDLKPDVIVLDIEMPGLRGDEVTRRLRALGSPVRILVLSAHRAEHHISQLLACGAQGYVTKHDAIETIVEAIRGVMSAENCWLSPGAAAKIEQAASNGSATDPWFLTEREAEVLKLVAVGKTDQEIAQRLNISERTVRYHLHNIYRKLGVNRRCEVIVWALREGLGKYRELEELHHAAEG